MNTRTAVVSFVAWLLVGCAAGGSGSGRPTGVTVDALLIPADLGVVVDDKLHVIEVWPESAAAQAGIQVGDILLSVAPVAPGRMDEEVPFTESEQAKLLIGAAWAQEAERREKLLQQEFQREMEKKLGLASTAVSPVPTPEPSPTWIPDPKWTLTPLPTPVSVITVEVTPDPIIPPLPTPPPPYDTVRVKVNRGGEVLEIEVKPFPSFPYHIPTLPGTPTPMPEGYNRF